MDSDTHAPSHIINVNIIFKVKTIIIIITFGGTKKITTWIKYLLQKYKIHNFYVSFPEGLSEWGRPFSKVDSCLALAQYKKRRKQTVAFANCPLPPDGKSI